MPGFFNIPADVANPVMLEIRTMCDLVESDTSTQEVFNIYHFSRDGGNAGGANLATILAAFVSWHNSFVAPCLGVDYVGAVADLRMLDDPTALPLTPTALGGGAITGDRLPSFNAAVLQLVTNARGRCFRGSKHYGPIAEDGVTLDELVGATLTAFQALQNSMNPLLQFSDGSEKFNLCVLSRKNSNLIGPGVSFTYAQTIAPILNLKIGTMKRRKEGVGA